MSDKKCSVQCIGDKWYAFTDELCLISPERGMNITQLRDWLDRRENQVSAQGWLHRLVGFVGRRCFKFKDSRL
jgi:hypothetical protein